MRWTRRIRSASVVAGAAVGLLGCYTVISHPRINPQDQVTERGDVIGASECTGCHGDAELWSFHHGAPWYARSHEYYYYQYDPYFLGRSWYGDRYYYARWMAFYHHPWWLGTPSGYAWTPNSPALGRGEPRDSADSVEPRFFPLNTIEPGIMPFTRAGQPVSTGFVGGGEPRARRDSSDAQPPDYGRPVTVEPRYPTASPPPVSSGSSSGSSGSSSSQEKQASDDDSEDQEESQPRGRGDNREDSSGSQSR